MSSDPDLSAMIEKLTRRTAAAEARARQDGRGSLAERDCYHYRRRAGVPAQRHGRGAHPGRPRGTPG